MGVVNLDAGFTIDICWQLFSQNKWNLERVFVLVTNTQEFFKNATFDEGKARKREGEMFICVCVWVCMHVPFLILNSIGPDYVAGNITGDNIIKDDVKNKQSYMCDAETTYGMSSNFSNVTWSITFKNFRVQAFDFDGGNNPEFGSGKEAMHVTRMLEI